MNLLFSALSMQEPFRNPFGALWGPSWGPLMAETRSTWSSKTNRGPSTQLFFGSWRALEPLNSPSEACLQPFGGPRGAQGGPQVAQGASRPPPRGPKTLPKAFLRPKCCRNVPPKTPCVRGWTSREGSELRRDVRRTLNLIVRPATFV